MKIIVSPNERYEIDLSSDDEMSLEDFQTLVKKLNVVVTSMRRITNAKQISQALVSSPKGREAILEILRETSTLRPNTPEMEEVLKKHNVKWATILAKRSKWVKTHNITPQEIGLEDFPWGRKIAKPME